MVTAGSDGTAGGRGVLFVAFFFPPLGGGGVQRSLKFVRYLPAHGWRPCVLSAQSDYWMRDEALLSEVPAGMPVRRVPFGGHGLAGMGAGRGARSRTTTRLLRVLSRLVLVPDAYVGWSRRATGPALEEIDRRHCALIFTTSSPDSAHLLGRRLKRATGLPWVADFRDPWTMRLSFAPPTPLHRRLHLSLERSCLHEADAVVVTTPETREDLLRRHPGLDPARCHVIANGFDEEDFVAAQGLVAANGLEAAQDQAAARGDQAATAGGWIPAGGFPVLHAGQLNLDRPLAPFLAGLRLFLERGAGAGAGQAPETARGTDPRASKSAPPWIPPPSPEPTLFLLGPCYDSHRREVRAAGLEHAVRFLPGRTHQGAVAAMLSARVLLLLEHDSDRGRLVLPGKVFEYVRSGRPILAVVPPGGAAARFVRETDAGVAVDPSSPDAIAEALARLLARSAGPSVPFASIGPDEPIRHFERRVLTAQLATLFDAVAGGGPLAPA